MSEQSLPAQDALHQNAQIPPSAAEKKAHNNQPSVRRRNRLITSCLECRRRKLKCDKNQPCANCTKMSRQCIFIAPGMDPDAQAKLAEVKEKMGILERSLEANVARRAHLNSGRGPELVSLPGQELPYSDQEDYIDTNALKISHFAIEDAAYYEDEGNEDILDLGVAMGRVRLTERIGGLVRPRFSEELAFALRGLPQGKRTRANLISEQDPMSWLAPSRDYVAPASSFFFAPGIETTSLMTHLPSKALVDKLIAHYWIAVHVIARTVHRPSFERQYQSFWSNVSAGIEPRCSLQAVIFAALLSSVVSMSEEKVLIDYGVDKQSLVNNFREGTEAGLARANFLRTTKLETIQAFVMYLIPLCRNEISRAHAALTGTLIRLAECMGLHRDPTTYSTSPVETHVRRLMWYQICFLDLRACEATGPRPQIRADEFDTRFPLNIDDVDLDRAENGETDVDVRKDRTYFTDMTICRIRFECYEMHRLLWHERPKLERNVAEGEKKVTITSLLSRVQSFKAAMEKTYVPMLSRTVPLHALASEFYGIISDRLYILLLQKYLSSDRSRMPDRLRQLILGASVMILEHSMKIEQHPIFSTWKWYVGALHQYHVALILLSELYVGSREPAFELRVWKCLDYAFNLPVDMLYLEKVRMVLEELVSKTQIYASMKKVRAPNSMPHVGPQNYNPNPNKTKETKQRERSSSLHSAASSSGTPIINLGGSPMPQTSPAPARPVQPQSEAALNFSGAIPEVDWGTIDLSGTSLPSFQQPQQQRATTRAFDFADYDPNTTSSPPVSTGLMPPDVMTGIAPWHGIDAGSPAAAISVSITADMAGSSPMDALNDIDWNDIEQMFSGSEVSAGNMMVPPFTFPEFPATGLQWPGTEAMGAV